MSDIVERLREEERMTIQTIRRSGPSDIDSRLLAVFRDAADEIERNRKGESICIKCYLRQDAEASKVEPAPF